MIYSIAIDGPAGAGKSSVANDVAKRLGILHLDTGAMYRALAWKALQEGIGENDEERLLALTEHCLPEVRFENGAQKTLIDGTDVTGLIRTPEVSMMASSVSKLKGVRRAMVARQQEMAKQQSMLLDGRDIGTVVLPNATLKIYLTASAKVRAQRRLLEMQSKGDITSTLEEVLADVNARDEQDMNREVTPLRPAEDSQILDTSFMTQEQVTESILRRLSLKLGKKPERAEDFTLTYRIGLALGKFLFSTLMPVTCHNVEEAQMDAPFILLGNHNHLLDPVLIGMSVHRYHVRFMGKKELAANKLLAALFKKLRMIPVDRHHMDMGAIRASLKTLQEKHVLGIFPEGTRHHNGVMENVESGVAVLALRSGAPLLPAYITGKPRLFHRIHVYYGRPIYLNEIAEKGINTEACNEVTGLIRKTYQDMYAKYGGEFASSEAEKQ